MNIKFNKHNVTNTATKAKCRVTYTVDNRCDGRKVVTIRSKCINESLSPVFAELVENKSDTMQDVFCKDQVNIFEDNPLYSDARLVGETQCIYFKMGA